MRKIGAILGVMLLLGMSPLSTLQAQDAAADLEKLVQTIPPQLAPKLSFQTMQGQSVTEASLKGPAIVLNFWATWCPPCLEEMPTLNGLQSLYDPKVLRVVAVSIDRGGAYQVGKFLQNKEWPHLQILLDPKAQAMRDLKIKNLPTTVIFNGKGLEMARLTGTAHWDDPAFLDGLIAKTGLPAPGQKP